MTRMGRPIDEIAINSGVNPQIERSQKLVEWEAAIAAGATLEELYKWESEGINGYPSWFKARVLVWYERHGQFEAHVSDAQIKAAKKKSGK